MEPCWKRKGETSVVKELEDLHEMRCRDEDTREWGGAAEKRSMALCGGRIVVIEDW